jgi:hypothetical protein
MIEVDSMQRDIFRFPIKRTFDLFLVNLAHEHITS